MTRARQLGFAILEGKNVKHFGGSYLKNSNPKVARPISLKRSTHLVMRSSKARGSRSFLKHEKEIAEIFRRQSSRFGVKIYRKANAGNYLQLVVLPRSRTAFQGFLRASSGLIARVVTGRERGISATSDKFDSKTKREAGGGLTLQTERFWDQRPFTRIVEWGREFRTVSEYLLQSTLEALGFIPYTPRRSESTA